MIGENQRLTIEEALRAHTLDAAFVLHREQEIGSINTGKLADLVVLGQDVADLPPSDISGVPVWMTVLDGAIVYQAGD